MSDKFKKLVLSRKNFIFLDGAMGTMVQAAGLKLGDIPESLLITHPEIIENIHSKYIEAGSNIIYTNTFGASPIKLKTTPYSTKQLVEKGIAVAKKAAGEKALVALDIGPLGELLEPIGSLSFDEAYNAFKEIVVSSSGCDLIALETFTDLYELKAALLAVKENCDLPVICSMSFEKNGRTFTGCTVESFASVAVGLGADAIGINCGLGPKEIYPLAQSLCKATPENFPVFVKPNAGLPRADGSGYDLDASEFGALIALYADLGITIFGGCCGTTPKFIESAVAELKSKHICNKPSDNACYITTPTCAIKIDGITPIGERINPTGKKRFQQALREHDVNYILNQAIEQVNAGAVILDVNVGIPDIDEEKTLTEIMKALQSIVDVPLQLDSSDPKALETALRYYNGKPIVNSVNGEENSLKNILPLCKKYGAAVIGLTLDENGIPSTSDGRIEIAKKIINNAENQGISRNEIFIDCLTMTISSDDKNALITLDAVKKCRDELHVKTALGVSNVSFGLPCRDYLNTCFLTLATEYGLSLAIINPNVENMMAAIYSFRALKSIDKNSLEYVSRYKLLSNPQAASAAKSVETKFSSETLIDCVVSGLKDKAAELTKTYLETMSPLEIVDNHLIAALDKVGMSYETGKTFLPELLQSAMAAQSSFEIIKQHMAKSGETSCEKGKIVLATVKGDVHDIGKNIVKVVLENYGYSVIDLGRDVECEDVVKAVGENSVKLVGLSALMTTTLKSMEKTIKLLKEAYPDCKIMVGGAVLTPEYAIKIGADFYSKDAKQSADIAKKFFSEN